MMESIATGEPNSGSRVVSRAEETSNVGGAAGRFSLVAGISGIVFVLLYVGPLFGFSLAPSPTSGPSDVAAYYAQHAADLQSIQFLRALSTVFFLMFLTGLWRVLQGIEARPDALATGVVAAGVTIASMGLVLYAARQAITLNATQLQDPAVVQTIRDFSNAIDVFTLFPVAVLVALTSWILLGSRGGSRWIGQAGILVVGLLVLGTLGAIIGPLRPLGVIGFLVSNLWLAALAILLCVRGFQTGRPAAAR
jgi:hypothetical protein